jgi:hypothetical protein
MQITSLLSPFHLGINSAIISDSLLNYGVPVMENPDIESFCQQNKNQLDTIKYVEYSAIFSLLSSFLFLKNILHYSFFLGSFLF